MPFDETGVFWQKSDNPGQERSGCLSAMPFDVNRGASGSRVRRTAATFPATSRRLFGAPAWRPLQDFELRFRCIQATHGIGYKSAQPPVSESDLREWLEPASDLGLAIRAEIT